MVAIRVEDLELTYRLRSKMNLRRRRRKNELPGGRISGKGRTRLLPRWTVSVSR
jgi:hypothetical protein